MKKNALIFLALFACKALCYSQPVKGTGSKVQPTNTVQKSKGLGQAQTNNILSGVNTEMHGVCLTKKFSIVFYLIEDSLPGFITASNTTVSIVNASNFVRDSVIARLNRAFKPICVQFECCSIYVIPNFNFNQWRKNVIDTFVTKNWFTPNTINVYLPEKVLPPIGGYENESYTYPAPASNTFVIPPKNAIVCDISGINAPNLVGVRTSELIHAFGHFFGLPHTFEDISPTTTISVTPPPPPGVISYEFADGSNCSTHGDGFCDTEADPYPQGAGPSIKCYLAGGLKDGKGVYYVGPTDNFMTFSECRCRFTTEQYNYMAQFILNHRWYLH